MAVEDETKCDNCGSTDLCGTVHMGSYVLMCRDCRRGVVATSFIAVAPLFDGRYRATHVDEDLNELGLVAEGEMPAIVARIREFAGSGKRVLIEAAE